MRLALPLLLATHIYGAAVKADHTPLRTGCYDDSATIVTLLKGAPVAIRYSLAGEAVPCYKVAVESNGKRYEGYLTATMIEDVESFDKIRKDAAWLDLSKMMGALQPPTQAALAASSGSGNALYKNASDLIEAGQPAKALALLEPEMKKRKDPNLLMLAGIAAWRADDNEKALEHWRASLALNPSPELEAMYKRVEQEKNGDKSGERLLGMRVQMRYEGVTIPADSARQMLGVLDEEFARVSSTLGCVAEERVTAVAQSPQAYKASTNAAEWSGGQFDGKIRVPVFEARGVDVNLRRTLTHEMTHACLFMLGRWPAWLHEGVAQYVSGERLPDQMRDRLRQMAAAKQLPTLDQLGQNWGHLDAQHAQLAYAMALLAIETFERDYAAVGLRNLFRNGERLGQITADLDRRLSQ